MKWDRNPINVGNPKSKKMKQKETIQSYLGWPYQMHTRESQWPTSLPSFCCWLTNNQGLRAKIKRLWIVGIKWDKCDEHMRHGNGLSCTDQSGPSRHTVLLAIQPETPHFGSAPHLYEHMLQPFFLVLNRHSNLCLVLDTPVVGECTKIL